MDKASCSLGPVAAFATALDMVFAVLDATLKTASLYFRCALTNEELAPLELTSFAFTVATCLLCAFALLLALEVLKASFSVPVVFLESGLHSTSVSSGNSSSRASTAARLWSASVRSSMIRSFSGTGMMPLTPAGREEGTEEWRIRCGAGMAPTGTTYMWGGSWGLRGPGASMELTSGTHGAGRESALRNWSAGIVLGVRLVGVILLDVPCDLLELGGKKPPVGWLQLVKNTSVVWPIPAFWSVDIILGVRVDMPSGWFKESWSADIILGVRFVGVVRLDSWFKAGTPADWLLSALGNWSADIILGVRLVADAARDNPSGRLEDLE